MEEEQTELEVRSEEARLDATVSKDGKPGEVGTALLFEAAVPAWLCASRNAEEYDNLRDRQRWGCFLKEEKRIQRSAFEDVTCIVLLI